MSRPPRSKTARVLTRPLLQRILQSASIITLCTLWTYAGALGAGSGGGGDGSARATTLTFTCFVLCDMFNALGCRSEAKSVLAREVSLLGNAMFNLSVAGSLLGQAAVVYVPALQRVFQTEALAWRDWAWLVCVASCVFWADEGRKWWRRRRRRGGVGGGYSRSV